MSKQNIFCLLIPYGNKIGWLSTAIHPPLQNWNCYQLRLNNLGLEIITFKVLCRPRMYLSSLFVFAARLDVDSLALACFFLADFTLSYVLANYFVLEITKVRYVASVLKASSVCSFMCQLPFCFTPFNLLKFLWCFTLFDLLPMQAQNINSMQYCINDEDIYFWTLLNLLINFSVGWFDWRVYCMNEVILNAWLFLSFHVISCCVETLLFPPSDMITSVIRCQLLVICFLSSQYRAAYMPSPTEAYQVIFNVLITFSCCTLDDAAGWYFIG